MIIADTTRTQRNTHLRIGDTSGLDQYERRHVNIKLIFSFKQK